MVRATARARSRAGAAAQEDEEENPQREYEPEQRGQQQKRDEPAQGRPQPTRRVRVLAGLPVGEQRVARRTPRHAGEQDQPGGGHGPADQGREYLVDQNVDQQRVGEGEREEARDRGGEDDARTFARFPSGGLAPVEGFRLARAEPDRERGDGQDGQRDRRRHVVEPLPDVAVEADQGDLRRLVDIDFRLVGQHEADQESRARPVEAAQEDAEDAHGDERRQSPTGSASTGRGRRRSS